VATLEVISRFNVPAVQVDDVITRHQIRPQILRVIPTLEEGIEEVIQRRRRHRRSIISHPEMEAGFHAISWRTIDRLRSQEDLLPGITMNQFILKSNRMSCPNLILFEATVGRLSGRSTLTLTFPCSNSISIMVKVL
jgi:hypothetical protein